VVLSPWLFTALDVKRLSDEARIVDPGLKPIITSQLDLIRAAQLLYTAFDWAIRCEQMEHWFSEPDRIRAWYRHIKERAYLLMQALDLSPAKCRDTTRLLDSGFYIPSIADFRLLIDNMIGIRPPLPDEIDRLCRLACKESELNVKVADIDPSGKCPYRQQASFQIDRLPRTLALLAELAEYNEKQVDSASPGRGRRPDQLRRQLFKGLACAHEKIFGRKPRTRNKLGQPRLGSIKWARLIIDHAIQGIADPAAKEAVRYVARLRAISRQSDASIAAHLDEGWKLWQAERSYTTAL
jgi:hypothetical protein